MTRHAATFAAGLALGALLAILLTSNVTSRQPSAPRPAATILATLRPVAPLRTGAPRAVAVPNPTRSSDSDVARSGKRPEGPPFGTPPSPTTDTGIASVEPAADPIPSVAPTPKPTKRPRATTRPVGGLSGVATWYDYRRGQAAAGPRLRAALGAGWRGETVLVNGVPVLLTDHMGTRNRDKVIDLDAGLFQRICGPLSLGVCEVEVRW